jgi:hypothetical protein
VTEDHPLKRLKTSKNEMKDPIEAPDEDLSVLSILENDNQLGLLSKFFNLVMFWKKKDKSKLDELIKYDFTKDFRPLGRALHNWK